MYVITEYASCMSYTDVSKCRIVSISRLNTSTMARLLVISMLSASIPQGETSQVTHSRFESTRNIIASHYSNYSKQFVGILKTTMHEQGMRK